MILITIVFIVVVCFILALYWIIKWADSGVAEDEDNKNKRYPCYHYSQDEEKKK